MPEHYFSPDPAAPSHPTEVELTLPDLTATLRADRGVFSGRRVDPGTKALLLEPFAPTAPGPLVDLGCGYGPIAVALASRYPDRTVIAVDVNARARALVEENATRLGLRNLSAYSPDDAPVDRPLGGLWSNPPIRIGKASLHSLLLMWLGRLDPAATGYLVVQRNLGADSLSTWLDGEGWAARRVRSRAGYRLLSVSRADR